MTNVPAGLTAVATRDSDTQVTLTLTGNATSHVDTDDINNLSIAFEDAAFTNVAAVNITDSSRADIVVDFNDAPTITYDVGTFTEDIANDGSITSAIIITLTGETFTGTNGDDFVAGSQVTMTNVPAGLTAVATRDTATQVTLTLTGSATSHIDTDDINNLSIAFENTAFTNVAAVNITDSSRTDIICLLYTSPSPRDRQKSRMPSSA